MYLEGVPTQDQVRAPPVAVTGDMLTVTAAPVDVLAVLPSIVITPASVTLPPETLPITLTVSPAPMEAEPPGSVWYFSEIEVRNPDAARISSETFARMV